METYWDVFIVDYYNKYNEIKNLPIDKLLELFWNFCNKRDDFINMFNNLISKEKEDIVAYLNISMIESGESRTIALDKAIGERILELLK
jgi:hypothetical protein